jgi:FixJ family two-component response regulator
LATDARKARETRSEHDAGSVFLVDDDPAVRRALVRLLRAQGLAASSFATAEDFLSEVHPDVAPACLVVDLLMPVLGGLELQSVMQRRGFDMPIVFISGWGDLASGVRAMKGGAVDFLEKPVCAPDFLAAVRRAIADHRDRRRARTDRDVLQRRLRALTPREHEVFDLIVTGLLNKQVGAQLGASEKTIKVHRARVMQKMGAGSLAELVRMAGRLQSRRRSDGPEVSRETEDRPKPP